MDSVDAAGAADAIGTAHSATTRLQEKSAARERRQCRGPVIVSPLPGCEMSAASQSASDFAPPEHQSFRSGGRRPRPAQATLRPVTRLYTKMISATTRSDREVVGERARP